MTAHRQLFRFILLPLILGFSLTVFGQKSENKQRNFCDGNNYSYNDRASFKELRELNASAGSTINVDARRNGGISVRGENRSDVLIRACVQTTGDTETEAANLAKSIRIETGSQIRATGGGEENGWAVSYEILVPRNSNLNLTAKNGGISVRSVEGNIEFETQNGGVAVKDAAGDVKGRTINGGVSVELSGTAWRGNGIDVQTTNGGVHLSVPENFAANIEAGTVNGGFKSDIAALSISQDGNETHGRKSKRINTTLNGGGANVRVVTTNGGIKISSASSKED